MSQVRGGVVNWKVVSTGTSGFAETGEDGGFTLHILDTKKNAQRLLAKTTVEEIEISFSKTTQPWDIYVGYAYSVSYVVSKPNRPTLAACRKGLAPGSGFYFDPRNGGICKHLTSVTVAAARTAARTVR